MHGWGINLLVPSCWSGKEGLNVKFHIKEVVHQMNLLNWPPFRCGWQLRMMAIRPKIASLPTMISDNSHSQLSTSGFLGSWNKMWLIYSYSTVHNICDSWTCMTATLSFLTPSLSDHMPTNEVRDLVSNANLLNKFSVALSNHWSNASISLSVSIPLSEFIS